MSPREAALGSALRKELARRGFYVRKVHSGRFVDNGGLLDYYAANFGLSFWIETKRDGKLGNVSKLQQRNLDQLNRRGIFAVAADDVDLTLEAVTKFIELHPHYGRTSHAFNSMTGLFEPEDPRQEIIKGYGYED